MRVQSISYSLLCRWFRAAVLPLDESLEADLLHQKAQKRCTVCGQPFLPGSNRAKYCKILRRHRSPQAENFKRPEKEGCLRTIRDEKTHDSIGFVNAGQRDRG